MRLFFIFILPTFIFAANLHNIIEFAQNNELSRIKNSQIASQTLEYEKSKSGYLPKLSLQGGYQNTSKERFIITPKESFNISAKIEFLIYDGGSREANLEALTHKINIAGHESEEMQNLLALNAVRLYFGYLSMQNIIEAKIAQREFLHQALKRIDKYHAAGLAAIDEKEMLEANYQLSNADVILYQQKLEEIKNAIYLLTSYELTPDGKNSIQEPNFTFKNTKPTLLSINEEIMAAQANVRSKQGEFLPKIFISDTYSFYKNEYGESLDFPPYIKGYTEPYMDQILKEKMRNNVIMVGFEWTIFDFFQRDKEVEMRRLAVQQSSLNYNYKKRENEVNLKNIQNAIKTQKSLVEANLFRKKAAITAFLATKQKYEAGLLGYSEFLQALSTKFEAEAGYNLALSELEIKKANYFYENGEDIAKKVK